MRGYHFCYDSDKGPILRDRTPCPGTGEVEIFDGKPRLCTCGLHAGLTPYYALKQAYGPWLRYVELAGQIDSSPTKACATIRKTLIGPINVTCVLRLLAGVMAARALTRYADAMTRKEVLPVARLAIQIGKTGALPDSLETRSIISNAYSIASSVYPAGYAAEAAAFAADTSHTIAFSIGWVIDIALAAASVHGAYNTEQKWQEYIVNKMLNRALGLGNG